MPAPGEYRIVAVEQQARVQGPAITVVTLERKDGYRRQHGWPEDAPLLCGLEYGLDRTDPAALLDVLFHQNSIPDPITAGVEKDYAARHGYIVDGRPVVDEIFGPLPVAKEPGWLYNTTTTAVAREAHLLRVDDVKTRMHVRLDGKAYDLLRRHHDQVLDLIDTVSGVGKVYEQMAEGVRATKAHARKLHATPLIVRRDRGRPHGR